MILFNMKEPKEINNDFVCEFCKKSFIREKSLISHSCEKKRRWLNKDLRGNQIGFQSFVQFYSKHSAAKKTKTYEEFIHSPYFLAFAKFGNYCIEVNVINVSRYVDWLLKDGIKITEWTSDKNYTKFLTEYLRTEDPFDALARSVNTCAEIAETDGIQVSDVLRYGNPNRICREITNGKISPWMLYQSNSGTRFLDTLNQDHVKIIIDYINPEMWALKFKREPKLASDIKDTLNRAGY